MILSGSMGRILIHKLPSAANGILKYSEPDFFQGQFENPVRKAFVAEPYLAQEGDRFPELFQGIYGKNGDRTGIILKFNPDFLFCDSREFRTNAEEFSFIGNGCYRFDNHDGSICFRISRSHNPGLLFPSGDGWFSSGDYSSIHSLSRDIPGKSAGVVIQVYPIWNQVHPAVAVLFW